MKKRAGALALCLLYIVLLSGLLIFHIQSIAGERSRYLATAEVLLLVAFCIIMIVFSLRREAEAEASQAGNYIQNYEQFLAVVEADGLSEREKEVAWLIYRGFTNRQIAEELFIAETTVKKHVSHIYEKCGVSGRKELKEQWRK